MARVANVTLLSVLGVTALASGACLEEQRFAVERDHVDMPPDTPVAFVDDDDNPVFIVQAQVPAAALAALATAADADQSAQGKNLPFPRMPWVEREDLEMRVDYTLDNRSDEPSTAMDLLDGMNEFIGTPGRRRLPPVREAPRWWSP